LADVVSTTTEPRLGAIRLAWWRERLEALDEGVMPEEPRLSAVNRQLLGRGITGKELSELEDAWLPLLEPFPWNEAQAEGLRLRGRILFAVGARLLSDDPQGGKEAGAFWSLVDGAFHCSDATSRDFLLIVAREALRDVRPAPRIIRPLTILAALAAHDLRSGGSLGRVGAALAHRMTGKIPR
jgi:15-cis-phytoene synthase